MLKSISQIRLENVERLMQSTGLNRKDFSEKSKIAYPQFGQYFANNPQKIIGDSIARRIETAFELEEFWLDQNWGDKINTGNVSIGGHNNGIAGGQGNIQNNYGLNQTVLPSDCEENPPTYLKDIPLLDIDMGVLFALNPNLLDNAIYDNAERVATFIPHSSKTFGIKNNTDITGITPSTINRGDILIVEPCIAPRDRDLVLLCLDYGRTNRGVIARLFVDLAGNRTVQHNDNSPTIMPANSLICGVIVEIKRRLLDTTLAKARLNPTHEPISTLESITTDM